jgi:hypothetical protein
MSVTYNYSLDWIGRDALTSGDPKKEIKASLFLDEWTAIQSAFAAAAPTASPTFTGTLTATVIAASGNVTGANLNVTNWDLAHGWGDHGVAGYCQTDGSDATGTWGISITGNAATATDCSRSVIAGTNLNGGGALSGDVTLNLDTSPSVTSLVLGSFTILDSGTDLLIQYGGANVAKITSTGAIEGEGDVTAFATIP